MPTPKEFLYLEVLRFCLDPNDLPIPSAISIVDWNGVLEFAQKQAIVGVFANTILDSKFEWLGNKPSDICLMKWFGYNNINPLAELN